MLSEKPETCSQLPEPEFLKRILGRYWNEVRWFRIVSPEKKQELEIVNDVLKFPVTVVRLMNSNEAELSCYVRILLEFRGKAV